MLTQCQIVTPDFIYIYYRSRKFETDANVSINTQEFHGIFHGYFSNSALDKIYLNIWDELSDSSTFDFEN